MTSPRLSQALGRRSTPTENPTPPCWSAVQQLKPGQAGAGWGPRRSHCPGSQCRVWEPMFTPELMTGSGLAVQVPEDSVQPSGEGSTILNRG